jgi:hypothetical protein
LQELLRTETVPEELIRNFEKLSSGTPPRDCGGVNLSSKVVGMMVCFLFVLDYESQARTPRFQQSRRQRETANVPSLTIEQITHPPEIPPF